MKVPELKARAKYLGFKGYSKLRKDELIALLTPPAPDLQNPQDLHHLRLPCHLQLPNQIVPDK